MTTYKQPISALVVIYTSNPPARPTTNDLAACCRSQMASSFTSSSIGTGLEVLLLERADYPGYWQSVTGSRDGGESLRETAIRETFEETGLDAILYALTDWQVQNVYDIYPKWQHRYPHGTTHNTEHVFGLELPAALPVQLSPREHLSYIWLPWREAANKVFSPSNRAAIMQLPERQIPPDGATSHSTRPSENDG